ncbi:Endonuclease/exonuclease/phosphatase [Suillus clintonianus]|uniref:Endonuclease/exonuclease/phosphatase n=1 Tax=Suillus clintonianus TaxID=1904413 RepID=UPI001B881C73|nr:Endonuclease/exonuclease/phosphatase [Suillus clintonianus]KAG2154561.1 Endonuclease/exonuclease/phosphatase [Suillus clintonianus]
MAEQIRVVSLNCWGLKYVSKDRAERVAAIASALARSDYDIIALQEIWVEADYNQIRESVVSRLPYTKLFHSGALGAGLGILTKWPIIATSMTPYSLVGEPTNVFGGDWFVGKGAGSVTIMHPVLGAVELFVTHFCAQGGESGPEYNRTYRLVNAWEFAKVTRQAAELGRYVIAMGDFNSIPAGLPMNVVLNHAGLVDSWATSHAHIPPPSGMLSPIEGVLNYGVTADSPLNSYRDSEPSGDPIVRKYQGKRLDYILFRHPSPNATNDHLPRLTCRDSQVVFTDTIPGNTCSYSDHFGIEATLSIDTHAGNQDDIASLKDTWYNSPSELSSNVITEVMSAFNTSYRMSQDRSRKELTIFGVSIFALIGLIIGSAWVIVPWLNPIFVLLVIYLSWLATTKLYEGFIFGNWERKALQNVIEELELYKHTLATQAPHDW